MARRRRTRRGVLLLIVLSLLVLFLLVGLSFMVSAGQFKRLASSASKTEVTGTPGHKLADNVMYQLLRGTNNPYSSLQGHSLLEDLYGRDYLIGTVDSIREEGSRTAQQIQSLQVDVTNQNKTTSGETASAAAAQVQLTKRDDYYAGCVLTFLDGPAKGKSTRVLKYKPESEREIVIKGVVPAPTANSRFIINGRPFNGTGAGYNYQTGELDQGTLSGGPPVAYLPNYSAYLNNSLLGSHLSGNRAFNFGGMDESYDSVDYQNMFLAKPSDPLRYGSAAGAVYAMSQGESPDTSTAAGLATAGLMNFYGRGGGAIPSFHRPFLMAHMQANLAPAVLQQYQRAISLRPIGGLGGDHPAFTGSNPQYDPVYGPWDVDNDGDGIPESIWVDAGLSPVAGPDGRLYKPLVAVYVVDMDGRLNINAIDSISRDDLDVNSNATVRNGSFTVRKPDLGLGYGPADISFGGVTATNYIRSRYAGKSANSDGDLIERNGEPTNSPPGPEDYTSNGGVNGVDDISSPDEKRLEKFMFFQDQSSVLTGFGSPLDLHGRGVPLLDKQGNVIWAGSSWFGTAEGIDDPYEINLLTDSPFDNPYALNELESLLTTGTTNTGNPSRTQINSKEIPDLRRFNSINPNYTTRSFSIPAVAAVGAGRYRGAAPGDGLPRTVREMFAAKLIRGGVNANRAFNLVATWDLIAPEFERGEKMDINRVLVPTWNNRTATAGDLHHRDQQRRITIEKERFARHLFNLMMMVSDEPDAGIPGLTPAAAREAHVRRIAQWAINVVDFGDADSVMTRFRYDANPFNNQPILFGNNGEPRASARSNPDFREIWGMEHPEIILTETLAIHDRRVEDTDRDDGEEEFYDPDDATKDGDFDSVTRPEGSLFVELLCVRGQTPSSTTSAKNLASHATDDLYTADDRLNLAATSPDNRPVWRLAISEPTDPTLVDTPRKLFEAPTGNLADKYMLNSNRLRSFEPKDAPSPAWVAGSPDPLDNLNLDLERFIWFTPTATIPAGGEETASDTYVNTGVAPAPRPGDYVLVGPRFRTSIGLEDDLSPSPQVIDLDLNHRDADDQILRRGIPNRTIPVVARTTNAVDAGCSVSEPLATVADYYDELPDPAAGAAPDAPVEEYATPIDEPLDTDAAAPLSDLGQETDTHEDYRTVFLQRLADPNLAWNNNPADPFYNPYRTIDWMPIDLTVFNSLDDGTEDPDDPNPQLANWVVGRDGARFSSLEKSGYPDRENNEFNKLEELFFQRTPTKELLLREGFGLFNIWSAWTSPAVRVNSEDGPVQQADNTTFIHTLGWLNRSFNIGLNPTAGNSRGGYEVTGGPYSGAPAGSGHNNVTYTFPSLVWHNRPYANPFELMLVPATSSSRLSADYSTSLHGSPVNHQSGDGIAPPAIGNPRIGYRGAFGHLLNFFHSSTGVKGETTDASGILPANFYRIFDFVDVPSRFRGTETWLTKDSIAPNSDYYVDYSDPVAKELSRGTISEHRVPGKVNPNTFRPDIGRDKNNERQFAELLGFNSLIAPRDIDHDAWLLFQQSLAGGEGIAIDNHYSTGVTGRYPNGNFPAEYPNPLRSGTSGDLVPRWPATSARPAVDATMLRSNPSSATNDEIPALAPYDANPPNSTVNGLQRSVQNRKSNAYFRYKDLMKLGNSVTSQSNVYAVWVTVGYFEVLPNMDKKYTQVMGIDGRHSDGYQLGVEMGSDIGQVTRHRSMYIIDRSVPVAFQPGANHNVDNAVLLRRRLE